MQTMELERRYLAKSLPEDLAHYPHLELLDIYIPQQVAFPKLRLRQQGNRFEITKKELSDPASRDSSQIIEYNIPLEEEEFRALTAHIEGRRIHKLRYQYEVASAYHCTFDVFLDNLAGLILIDFEFSSLQEMAAFTIPDFCLEEVTQEQFLAGGDLSGKYYVEIASRLATYGYRPLTLPLSATGQADDHPARL